MAISITSNPLDEQASDVFAVGNLVKSDNGKVVLVTTTGIGSDFSGFCLIDPQGVYGLTITGGWAKNCFTPYKGTITIKAD